MKFWIFLLAILYALSPYDLLPDFIAGVGWVDDLIILGLLWWYLFVYRSRKKAGQRSYHYTTKGKQGRFQGAESFKARTDFEEKTREMNPHQVLGVEKDASSREIKAAYKRLANQYHPDKVSHLGEEFKILAEKRFKEIQEAYQELQALGR